MRLDWSQLPKDLLVLIANKLTSILDYGRFRAVCSSWRSQTSPRPRHLPPQAPWLMGPYDPHSSDTHRRPFLDLLNGRAATLELPETHVRWCCGSSHGWLVLEHVDGIRFSLLNPVTRQQIQLPRLTRRPKVLRIPPSEVAAAPDHDYACELEFADCFIHKAILSANPSLESEGAIMAILRAGETLAFCRIGDESWTFIHDLLARDRMMDVAYRDGRFFSVNGHGRVVVYDINGSPWRTVLTSESPLGEGRYVFVEESSGSELLLVARNSQTDGAAADCRVFRMNLDGIPEWIEVRDLGERMLFLSGDNKCFSLSTSHSEGLIRKNCISFIHSHHQDGNGSVSYRMGLFSLDEGLLAETSDLGPFASHWSQPMWIAPSLC